ncbi:MAG: hypothetical protein JST16_00025 [Bdellovibrionales bacterium]|nr:hypothetical protein [Bdellovibrionales bacterium]
MFFTFNSAQNLTGPFIDPGREAIYVDSLFRILIQAAHTQAAKYIDANSGTFLNDRAYFAFLLGALVVPWHESNLTHYRRFSPVDTHCAARMNSGTALLRDKTLYDVFIRNIRPQLPDCSTLPKSADAIQLVGSEDAFSNGIMQVAINFHEDDYVANGTYRSVPATVRYGLKYFFAGYDGVLWNAKQYSCIFASDGKTIDYQKLLRGAWAGKYNSGNLASTCRFTNPNSKWATNDKVFLQHLTAILNKTTNPYTTNLTGAARAAYDELVGNVLTGTRNLKYLTPLLTTAKAMTDDSAL